MNEAALPWYSRIWLAWVCWFRVLFDGRFAYRAAQLTRGSEPEALPPAPVEPAPATEPPAAPADTGVSALQLLALLQREGRLVDFLEQDIAAFSDQDIGAAARVVHAGCRKALHAHAALAPVRSEPEGSSITLQAGFDPDALKLTGNLGGSAPYHGVLRHRGWRVERFELPSLVGKHDPHVLAPAEVEL